VASPVLSRVARSPSQDAVGLLGHLGTLLAHVQPPVNQYAQVLFHWAASWKAGPGSLLRSRLGPPKKVVIN